MKRINLCMLFFILFYSLTSNASGNKNKSIQKNHSAVDGEEQSMPSSEGIIKERANRYSVIVKEEVANSMRDPSSTQFRNVVGYYNKNDGSILICGEFNSKNGYGAYVGFKWFVSNKDGGKDVSIDGVDVGTPEFSKKSCNNKIGIRIDLSL